MERISILDCTLRDGGYCNQWRFGQKNIRKIIKSLLHVNIEIIECGILSDRHQYEKGSTLFGNIAQASGCIDENNGSMVVCLANYGRYDFSSIPWCDDRTVTGIRVAFHKKDIQGAMQACRQVKRKGYRLFMQPMVSLNYSDQEFLELVNMANELHPFAFYIVDSFGAMTEKDLKRLFHLADHNLEPDIHIGFHPHNNLQLAYANAKALVSVQTSRKLIIDCSIMGMGRGAGNLNTELFADYLNCSYGKQYKIDPLLVVIDQILDKFYSENPWGFSLANYLSARHNLHPNYAKHLVEKQTLTAEDIHNIFLMIAEDKKVAFDSEYIESLYLSYMGKGEEKADNLDKLKRILLGREVIIIAPGASSRLEKDKIIKYLQRAQTVSVSINFDYPYYKTDFIFLSNLRRFQSLDKLSKEKCIVTSNIPVDDTFLKTKYADLLNENEFVRDNAGMMLIRYLIRLGVKKITLAGMDGYAANADRNYFNEEMAFPIKVTAAAAKNSSMSEMLKYFSKEVKIQFLTTQKYVRV